MKIIFAIFEGRFLIYKMNCPEPDELTAVFFFIGDSSDSVFFVMTAASPTEFAWNKLLGSILELFWLESLQFISQL